MRPFSEKQKSKSVVTGRAGCAKLFLLFDKVGAADETNSTFVSEGGEEL